MKIAVIGLGYVGLPLALRFSKCGVKVLGLDIDSVKVDKLLGGESYIKHITSERIQEEVKGGLLDASTDFSRISECDGALICVPTPLGEHQEPNLKYVLETGRAIGPHLKEGSVVVLESTTYPGTTEEDLRAVLEESSGKTAGVDFHLAYSPEREDPGNPNSIVEKIPKVIGGLTPQCLEKATEIYSKAINHLVPVSSPRAAEATKLLENIYRCVNISMVNELKMIYAKMGIDIWEVIEAAKTKPFGFTPFYPGPGLGGHCIPIDPFYLSWKAREYGERARFIELAGHINNNMPDYVISRAMEALNAQKKTINGSKALIIGLAYKPNVDDDRESPSYVLMDMLKERGAEVSYCDPHVHKIHSGRKTAHWDGLESVPFTKESIESFDLVIVSTAHEAIDHTQLAEWASCIIDTRNSVPDIDSNKVWKA